MQSFRRSRKVRVTSVELHQLLGCVLEIFGRIPVIIFIADLFRFVLELSVVQPDGNDLFDFLFCVTVHFYWWCRVDNLAWQWLRFSGSA
jgi:hypothetical protein